MQVGQKARRGLRRKGMAIEITAQVLIPALPAYSRFDGAQKGRAFLVSDVGHAVIRIATGQIDMQAGVGQALGAQTLDLRLQAIPAQVGQHQRIGRPVDALHDAIFKVSGEPFVEPEVGPGGVGHQIA